MGLMDKPQVMIIGEKESFLIRTLCKKLSDAGYEAFFANADVNSIADKWDKARFIIYYPDAQSKPKQVVLHYLKDTLTETDKNIILVGERSETEEIKKSIGAGLVMAVFTRPLQTEELIKTLDSHSSGERSGEKKKSILIVDDDSTYLGVIRDWLRDYYKVSMANSGLQALKWLGSNKADLILLDYEMPVTSGPHVLEMLRSEHDTASIPVFFLTGRGDRESVMQVMALKPENYLLKTITKDQLLAKLMEFFSSRS